MSEQSVEQPPAAAPDASVEAELGNKKSLDILELILTAHAQNGLRHGDYHRYQQYCSRRLRRLRTSLKFTCGKNRFHNKIMQPQHVVDARFLHIPLMQAERAWALAMQLKEDWQADPEDRARLKFHSHRRLVKAAKWSGELQRLAAATADPRTTLEADAYHAFISGSVALDHEKWVDALKQFVHAQTVYEQLVKVVDPEQQSMYRDRADQLENNVRLCKYKVDRLGLGDASASSSLNDLKDLKSGIDDLLRAKLEGVMQEARAKQAESMDKVTWLGRPITLKNAKVRVLLIQASETAMELELALSTSAASSSGDAEEQQPIDRYNALFQIFDDALHLTRADLKEMESMENKSSKATFQEEQLQLLRDYITERKLRYTMDRNLLLADSLASQLENHNNDEEKSAAAKSKRKHVTKPDEVAHIYELLLQNVESLTKLVGDQADQTLQQELAARSLTYQAFRCFYTSLSYAAAAKFAEAYVLLGHTLSLADSARDHHRMRGANVSVKELASIESLASRCNIQRCVVHANSVLVSLQASGSSAQKDDEKTTVSSTYLMDRLDRYDAGDPAAQYRLTHFPPQLEPVPCKPVLFDLASHHVEFPSDRLAAKIKSLQPAAAAASSASAASKPAAASAPAAAAAPAQPQQQQSKGGFFSFFRR